MSTMQRGNIKIFGHLWKNQKGATAIEYGLIAALIAVAAIGAFQALGGTVSGMFNSVASDVQTAIDGAVGDRSAGAAAVN